MQVKQCRCGGAMVEVPGYYNGPVHCGEAGCGESGQVTFWRGLKTIGSKMRLLDGLVMARRVCSRLPNPHPAYACSNPVDCPNPDNVRLLRPPFEVITRETQPTFPKPGSLDAIAYANQAFETPRDIVIKKNRTK